MKRTTFPIHSIFLIILWISGVYPPSTTRAEDKPHTESQSLSPSLRQTEMACSEMVRKKTENRPTQLPSDPEELRSQLTGHYMALGYVTPENPVYYWLDISVGNDNKVEISNLMDLGTTVTGTLDPARRTVTLPRQTIITHEEYGDLQIIPCDLDLMVYYVNEEIEFDINADGSLTTGNWGAFVLEGENKGKALVRYREALYPAKATMTDHSLTKQGEAQINSYPVVFVRENLNKILIKNFYNNTADVELTLSPDGSVMAAYTKVAVQRQPNGSEKKFFNWAVTDYVSPTQLKLNSKGVPGKWEGNTITLDRWAVSSGASPGAIYDLLEKSVIEVPETFAAFTNILTLEGEGTESSPYLIRSAADLCQLSSATNYGEEYTTQKKAFSGKHFLQTADIDLADTPNFMPIGHDASVTFCGIYNGGGHSIDNLNIDRRTNDNAGLFGIIGQQGAVRDLTLNSPSISLTKNKAGCLAAHSEGRIERVIVNNGRISEGNMNIGGLVGYFKGSIRDSRFTGTISGKNYVGGLAGIGWGSIHDSESVAEISTASKNCITGGIAGSLTGDTVVVRNAIAAGSIHDTFGTATIGGLSGYFQYGRMSGCVFTGNISSSSPAGTTPTSSLGGLAGMLCAGKIADCMMAGRVESADAANIAGLVGKVNKRPSGTDEPRIENSLVTGMLQCDINRTGNEFVSLATDKTVVTGCMYDRQTIGRETDAEGGVPTADLTSGQPSATLTEEEWDYCTGSYPVPAGLANTIGGRLAASAFILSPGDDVNTVRNDFTLDISKGTQWRLYTAGRLSDTGHGMRIDGGRARITAEEAVCDTLMGIQSDGRFKTFFLKILPQEYDGEGTAESPYLIRSVRDITRLSNAVDIQGVRYTDTHFRLEADLDFSGIDDFIGFSSQGVDRAFNGIFDGNGHSIRNWKADRVRADSDGNPTMPDADTRMAGFFLFTGRQCQIRNLTIDSSCSVTAGSHVAALVSQNYGLVENCRNLARVLAIGSETGGIAAANYDTGVIRKSYNAGAIGCGKNYAGGIAGANLGSIEACLNAGDVTNAHFSAASPGSDRMGAAGGIIGVNYGRLTESVNLASVISPRITGGLVGENGEQGTISSSISAGICHETRQTELHGAVAGTQKNGENALRDVYFDSQLTATCAAADLRHPGVTRLTTSGLTGGKLPEGLDSGTFSVEAGRYPLIKDFENEPLARFLASTFVKFETEDREDTRFFIRRPATIGLPGNTTVSATCGKFTTDGQTLSAADASKASSDTLTFVSGEWRKDIPLFSPGRLLAQGDGSVTAPWIITTIQDWNSVAEFTDIHDVDFRNEHFRLGGDVDFSNADFHPWFRTGQRRFEGTLDGAGFTIDNVTCDLSANDDGGDNVGLIGTSGESSMISDLTLGEGCIFIGHDNTGSFAGRSAGLIAGCTNNSRTVESTRVFSGGIAGYVLTGARFTGCINRAEVKAGSGQAGGIAGGNGGETGGWITGCANFGKVTSGTTTAGGIIGSCRLPVSDCVNNGDISAINSSAGGIIGYQASDFAIKNCENNGNVDAGTDTSGGIIGYLFNAAPVADCINRGNVNAGMSNAGGIAGLSGMPDVDISRCVNHGNIKAGRGFAGGIVGDAERGVVMTDVANHGDIRANIYAGGIAGGLKGSLERAMNTGTTVTETGFAGGLSGVNSTDGQITEVSCSFNVGKVMSSGTTADDAVCIGGLIGAGAVALSNTYNVADISAHRFAGGLIGLAEKGSTIKSAYNVGNVSCADASYASTCGNITGQIEEGATADVYFDSQFGSAEAYPADRHFEAVSTADLKAELLGEAFSETRHGGYPVLKAYADNPYAIVFSSALILKEGDTSHSVSGPFALVADPEVTWTSEHFTVEDALATPGGLPNGTYTIIAEANDICREFNLSVYNSGTDLTVSDGRIPVSTIWYAPDGSILPGPINGVCIRVTVYDDGTKIAEKTTNAR